MKPEEHLADKFLTNLGIGTPIYEPDGNVPPDFTFENQVGIEVRRLNKTVLVEGKYRGTEELSISLWRAFTDVLSLFDSQYNGKSYWVGIEFDNSFTKPTMAIKKQMKQALQDFLDRKCTAPLQIKVNDNIEFLIHEAQPIIGRVFCRAGSINRDESGQVLQMYISSVRHCIMEKTFKIASYKNRYAEWWLLLVDTMGWNMDRDETEILRNELNDFGSFDRVYIIDRNSACLFDSSS